MDLSKYPNLVKEIQEGQVILFLGSGASMEAKDKKGKNLPSGSQLGELLSKKFLGGKFRGSPLSQIGELAINEESLFTVQDYIRQLFEPFYPAEAHQLMTTFRWWEIITTNYDLLIERAYEGNKKTPQEIVPFVENGERVLTKLRNQNAIGLIKLHGCITRVNNKDCPLILAVDQYLEYLKGRDRLFKRFYEGAYEKTVLFIGHNLEDSDLRKILLKITGELGEARRRYFVIVPKVDEIQKRFWESRRITVIDGKFLEFMQALDQTLPKATRTLIHKKDYSHPIEKHFISNDIVLSENLKQSLALDFCYVKGARSQEAIAPKQFYKGYNPEWSAIEQDLDILRPLCHFILEKYFLETREKRGFEFLVIKGYAGSGKSVLLKRMAWIAAHDLECLCIFLSSSGRLQESVVQELVNNCSERVFLFIDNLAERVGEIIRFFERIGPEKERVTIITAERINEWNIYCEPIEHLASSEYQLSKLSLGEIKELLSKLEQHKALGELEKLSQEDREKEFQDKAGQQLLVALYEVTHGIPFEDIIQNEYEGIEPAIAREIYLSICTLNRLNIPVRAGIISRLHGIPFSKFKEKLFKPLENVVGAIYDKTIRDYVYAARHSYVAQIIFERVLVDPEKRFDSFFRCLKELDIDYETDRKAFRQMIHGRTLLEIFPNHEHVRQIYAAAEKMSPYGHVLYHQKAIYEMHRPNGNKEESLRLLKKADALRPNNSSIKHTFSEYFLTCAQETKVELKKTSCLKEAERGAYFLIRSQPYSSYGYHTLLKILIEKIHIQLEKKTTIDIEIEELIAEVEKQLTVALQRFPNNSYLLDVDARLATILVDSKRMYASLKKAFDANPRNSFIALRLARQCISRGEDGEAKKILRKALDARREERTLHFLYAKVLIDTNDQSGDVEYHLKRSFISGDKNFLARLLYGRCLYTKNKFPEAREVFSQMRDENMPPRTRNELRYSLDGHFHGEVATRSLVYCFIKRDGTRDDIYAYYLNMEEDLFSHLVVGSRVKFKIAFTFRGVNAFDVKK